MAFSSPRLLRLWSFSVLVLVSICSYAQSAQLIIEEHVVHDSENGLPELEGQITYRFYVQCTHPDDFVSAVYGGEDSPLVVDVETPMYNSPFATGSTGAGINPIVLNYFPEVAYDSWITIGLDQTAGAGESDVSVMESPFQPFLSNFSANGASSGLSLSMDDESGGAWFILTGMSNGYAGDDLRVLIMQITSASIPTGRLNVQVIPAESSVGSEHVQQGFAGTEVWDINVEVISGCTDELACNYDELATEDDGSCDFESCVGCTDLLACNYDETVSTDDGSCTFEGCYGCTDSVACNFDAEAIHDDGSCDYISCEVGGCTEDSACNYSPVASYDDGSCDYEECVGCMNSSACNYDMEYTVSDSSSCVFAESGLDCAGNCLLDSDLDGICDSDELLGCTDSEANNFDPEATEDDGSCLLIIVGCDEPLACNYDLLANENDGSCEFESCVGCTLESACNFDASSTLPDNDSCLFPVMYYDCDNQCIGDNDGDGICNELEVLGCSNSDALNYNSDATENDGTCIYESECHNPEACNYVSYDAYCILVEPVMVHDGMIGDVDLSGMTTYRIYALCENEDDVVSAVAGDSEFPTFVHSTAPFYQNPAGGLLAENSNPLVLPFVPSLAYDSWVTIGLDSPPSGNSDEAGVSVMEGTEPWINPFENGESIDISDDLGGVWYVLNGASNGVAGEDLRVLLGQFTTSGNLEGQMYIQFFIHGDGLNNGMNKLIGLHDACSAPELESCDYSEEGYDCEGLCLTDSDGDGICNEFEIAGCMDALANNFNTEATDEDGSCDFSVSTCAPDLTPPYFTWIPNDSTIQCDQSMPFDMALAEDECDADVQVEFVNGPIEFVLGCAPFNYLCTRTFTATDLAGNASTAVQFISVVDTLGPDFLTLPEELILVNEQEGGQIPAPFAVVQDACDGNASWISSDLLLAQEGSLQTIERTYLASDQCGNESDFVQTILFTVATYGCTDPMACNYTEEASNDDGTCFYPEDWYSCEGTCLVDTDSDGVCDALEVLGCTAENACNFDSLATEDDATCEFCSCSDEIIPVFGLEIDTVAVHTAGALEGMVTYQFFVTTEASDDFVSSIYGNNLDTLVLASSMPFHQDSNGALLPQDLNSELLSVFPDLAFDSWVTIGLEGPAAVGENQVNALGASGEFGWTSMFESGSDIVMNDAVGGSWFILNGGTNGVAGDDLRVLIGQVTTAGMLSGKLNVQLFENGDNDQVSLHHFEFEGSNWINPVSSQNACGCMDDMAFNYDPIAEYDNGSCVPVVMGCMDTMACNYDSLANVNDSSCTYAAEAYDCEGVCLLDSDGDEVCDALEVDGCMDSMACNFDDLSTDDDGSCVYPEFAYDCNGDCEQDTDLDGICDVLEVPGCMDLNACNFSEEATDDDGLCEYAELGFNCLGECLEDADEDGICDEFEVLGCTDVNALNFDSNATDDDGSCAYCMLQATAEVEHVSCNGDMTGSVLVSASGAYPNDSLMTFELLSIGMPQPEGSFGALSAGEHTVQVMDAAGCMASVDFEVLEPELLLVLLDEVIATEQDEAAGSIDISVTGGTGDYTFQWSQLGGSYSSDLEDIDNLEGGTYQVLVMDENNCTALSFEIMVETLVGVEETQAIELSMFPNPVVSNLTIDLTETGGTSSVEIFDASGRLVCIRAVDSGVDFVHVDCSSWSNGVYHVLVHSSATISSGKILINR